MSSIAKIEKEGRAMDDENVNRERAQRMKDQILKIEERNVKTNKSVGDSEMVRKIKAIIREEAEAK